jgi:phosphopantothenoylcysteine decarboxylase
VLHIELRKWADALVIAPLSANTLAKIVSGICDNLLTLICRCWDMRIKQAENKQDKAAK